MNNNAVHNHHTHSLNSMLSKVKGLLSPAQFTAVMTAVCSTLYPNVTIHGDEKRTFKVGCESGLGVRRIE